jgi:hypothetical protein
VAAPPRVEAPLEPLPLAKMSFNTQFSETTTISVMGKLKKAYEWIKQRDAAIDKTLTAIEEAYVAAPSDALKHLILKAYENHSRSKTVVSWEQVKMKYDAESGEDEPVLDKSGKPIWEAGGFTQAITDSEDWEVSLVKGLKAVRIHISKTRAEVLKKRYKETEVLRKVKVWE